MVTHALPLLPWGTDLREVALQESWLAALLKNLRIRVLPITIAY